MYQGAGLKPEQPMPTVSSGQTLDISAGESSASVEVLSGGILRVLSGGTAGRKALSGGEQRVAEGGTAGDTTVSGGGSRHDQ
jgi:autotransporter passenger strand-loop-strand repeat protein